MAVRNENTGVLPTDVQTFQLTRNLYAAGAGFGTIYNTFELAAADSDASIFRTFAGLGYNVIPLNIFVANDTITAGTDWDIGLYDTTTSGAVIAGKVNCFADALDLSTAHASLNPKTALDGMKDLAIESYGNRLYEHAGHTSATRRATYDIAMTANTIGSAAGTVAIQLNFALG